MIIKRKLFVDASYKNRKQKREADKRKRAKIVKDLDTKLMKASEKAQNIKPVKNIGVEERIISSRPDTKVLKDKRGNLYNDRYVTDDEFDNLAEIVDNNRLKERSVKLGQELRYHNNTEKVNIKSEIDDALKNNKKVVRYPKDAGIDTLSHEFGHLKNDDNKYPRELKAGEFFNPKERLKDERQASINAIGILKKAGASNKEIKQSKKNLREFEKTYKLLNKLERKSSGGKS